MKSSESEVNATERGRTVDDIPCYAPDLMADNEYFSEAHDCLRNQEDTYFWFVYRRKLLLHLVGLWAKLDGKFCEIGCGNARELQAIAGLYPNMDLYGSEIHFAPLRIAVENVPNGNFFQADLLSFPRAYSFDAVGVFDVLEHIEDDDKAMCSLYDCLSDNGMLIVTVPQHRWLWGEQDDLARHKRRYSRLDLQRKLSKAGFRVKMMCSYTALLLPVMLLARLASKLKANKDEMITDEFHISPLVNRICGAISELEVWLTIHGVCFPFGGSLVCVAEKSEE